MSCTIPANAFETRQVKCEIHGDYFNNKGTDGDITFVAKLTDSGGTDTISGTITVPDDASRYNYVLTLTITPTGTDTQTAFLALQSTQDNFYQVAAMTRAQDEQLTLDLTCQLDAADPDFECKRFNATVSVI
jgi:hypothetical protein